MRKDNIETLLDLSPMQEGMLFHSLYGGQNDPYVYQYASEIEGELDPERFSGAWQAVVNRHQALRICFNWRQLEKPVQIVQKRLDLDIDKRDWRLMPDDEQRRQVQAYLQAERERSLDLSSAPLIRIALIRLADRRYQFVWTFHHIILDGWSISLLLEELFEAYRAFGNAPPRRAKKPRPFGDYIGWLRQQDLARAEQFWRRRLAGFTSPVRVRGDAPLNRPADGAAVYGGETLSLSQETTAVLESLARSQRLTLSTIMQGGWALLLSRYSGQREVVFGTVVSGRPAGLAGVEQMVGLFINTLATRVRVEASAGLLEWLRQLQMQEAEAREYEYSPLVAVQGWSEVGSGVPLFESIVAFENYPVAHQTMAFSEQLRVSQSSSLEQNSYPLGLVVVPGASLALGISYERARFSSRMIQGMLIGLQGFLKEVVRDPNRRLGKFLDLWSPPSMVVAEPLSLATEDLYEQSNLSRSQLLFWLAQELQPDLPLFNMAGLFHISAAINRAAFEEAFQTLLNSCEALRTVIENADGIPQQKVLDEIPYAIEFVDFSGSPDPQKELRDWGDRRCRAKLDLSRCLFDTALLKLSEVEYAWYLNTHQLIVDAFSTALIVEHQSKCYSTALRGDLPDRVTLPQFQSHVEEERAYRHSARYKRAKVFWEKQLSAGSHPLSFYGRTSTALTAGVQRVSLELGLERTQHLKSLAARSTALKTTRAPLFNVLAALLLTYLHKVTGLRELSVGVPFHNRHSRRSQATIGLFMQVLPLRITIDREESFLSLINKVAGAAFDIVKHGPFTISNSLQNRAYEVLLNYHVESIPDFAGGPVRTEWLHPGVGNEVLAMQVHDFEASGAVVLDFDFASEVFDQTRIEMALDHFGRVLDSLDDPTRPLKFVSLLGEQQKRQVLFEFNRTEMAFAADKTFPELFEAQVGATPDRLAVADDQQQLTYARLNALANGLARQLKDAGIGSEDVVALLAYRGADLLAAIIAVMKAGAAYLPLDPFSPPMRHAQLLSQSRSRLALAAAEFSQRLSQALAAQPESGRLLVWELEEKLGYRQSEENLREYGTSNSLAYVIYTSGSTGLPKGVMIEQAGMINHLCAKIHDTRLTASDTLAQVASQCFDSSVWQFLAPLLLGARCHILSDEVVSHPAAMLDRIESAAITVLSTVPSMLRAMLEEVATAARGSWPMAGLHCLLEMGEALPVDLSKQFKALYPKVRLINAYGLTECSDDVTHYVVEELPNSDQPRVPIGCPIANTRFHILDPLFEPLPVGIVGELYVGGIATGRGYINNPQQTAEKFLPDPFAAQPSARLYRAGDLASYFPDGTVDYLGRIDHQVKIRGFRIEVDEIETALRLHPAIKESVVVAAKDASGNTQLIAYVVAATTPGPASPEVKSFLRERLPDYLVPAVIMTLDQMPLNTNGKVDRSALLVARPEPDQFAPEHIAPRNPWEFQLAQIWQELLGVGRIGVTDNFFDVGGHSLLAIRLLAKIKKQIGVELPLATLIEAGTIERLVPLLVKRQAGGRRSPLVAIRAGGAKPPFFCVHPGGGTVLCYLALAQRLEKEQPFYGLQDPDVLQDQDRATADMADVAIEARAALYIEAIKTVEARGPYRLGGWSFGGFVAFEMAQQLKQQGEAVELLAVFDTGPVFDKLNTADDAHLLASLCEEAGLQIAPEDLRSLAPSEHLNHVLEQLQALRLLPSEIPASWIARTLAIFKSRIRAVQAYRFRKYDGTITLFRASEIDPDEALSAPGEPKNMAMGWGRWSTLPVKIHHVAGNHASMMREPDVAELAEKLSRCLAEPKREPVSASHRVMPMRDAGV